MWSEWAWRLVTFWVAVPVWVVALRAVAVRGRPVPMDDER